MQNERVSFTCGSKNVTRRMNYSETHSGALLLIMERVFLGGIFGSGVALGPVASVM